MTNQIEIATSDAISNKKIVSHIGVVVGVGTVAFGPITTNKAKGAYIKAMSELKSSALEKGANAVISLIVTTNGSGFPFFRAQTIILTGTAVKVD
jgi:uncharacterized protein YbjQ (UPF0145 family)